MQRYPIESSNLDSVGYDEVNKVLEISFISGGIYQYIDVEPQVYEGLLYADSAGKYFHRNIKGQFNYKRV